MSCCRIFVIAVCLCTPLALAQNHSLITGKAGNNNAGNNNNVQQVPDFRIPPAATPSEPWRILPKPDSNKGRVIIVSPDGPLAAGTTCYAIRSYVLTPDAKDTDSVHPDGYSTCIPANNFQLKRPDDYFDR